MKIQLEVFNNNIAKKITTPELNGEIFAFNREDIDALDRLNVIKKTPMCYILYHDYYDRNINKNEVYIGQTDTGMIRIKAHHREKDDWNKGLIIFYGKPSFDVIFKLESDLIQLAKISMKYHVLNVKNESRGHVCDCQEEQYEVFLEKIQDVLNAINIDIFSRKIDGAFTFDSQTNLKASLIKCSPPYEIMVFAGSFAEDFQLGYTGDLFKKNNISTERREKKTTVTRRGIIRDYMSDADFYTFNIDTYFIIEEAEKMALYRFKNVNGLSMHKFID